MNWIKKYEGALMAGVFVLLGLVMFLSSFGMKSLAKAQVGPEFVPRIVAICMIGLGVMHVVSEVKGIRERASVRPAKEGDMEKSTEPPRKDAGKPFLKRHGFALTLALIFIYAALMRPAGFLLTTAVYLFCQIGVLARDLRPAKLTQYALISVVTSAGVYLLFVYVFGMQLPSGILG